MSKAGIDFSINYPAIVIETQYDYFFYSILRKQIKNLPIDNGIEIIYSDNIEDHMSDIDKFTDLIIDILIKHDVTECNIEGYSYGSVSSSYIQIIEYSTILRYKMSKNNIRWTAYSPKTIKKTAGKGNYTKEQMFDAFLLVDDEKLKSNIYHSNVLSNKDNIKTYKRTGDFKEIKKPYEDLIDAYYCLKTI